MKTCVTGKKNKKLHYDQRIFDWAVMLLARTSGSIYEEIAAVMMLPSKSWLLRKIREDVNMRTTWAFSVCTQTTATTDSKLMEKIFSPGSNTLLGMLAFDLAEARPNLGFNHVDFGLTGQDRGNFFNSVTAQFRAMAKDAAMMTMAARLREAFWKI